MPERITALIVQNGNVYAEGLSPATEALQAYWRDRAAHEEETRTLLTPVITQFQYTHGARDPDHLEPDACTLDQHFLELPGRDQVMLDLFYGYGANVESYPRWQAYLREHRPPTLVVWGQNDPFSVDGATAFRRDVPDAEIHLLDTGHFALEEDDAEIAAHIRRFLLENVADSTCTREEGDRHATCRKGCARDGQHVGNRPRDCRGIRPRGG